MVTHAEAESRVKLVFWIHCVVYALAIVSMGALNYSLTPQKLWAVWVAFGWGAGVTLHGVLLYLTSTRENAIKRTMVRMNRRSRS